MQKMWIASKAKRWMELVYRRDKLRRITFFARPPLMIRFTVLIGNYLLLSRSSINSAVHLTKLLYCITALSVCSNWSYNNLFVCFLFFLLGTRPALRRWIPGRHHRCRGSPHHPDWGAAHRPINERDQLACWARGPWGWGWFSLGWPCRPFLGIAHHPVQGPQGLHPGYAAISRGG